MTTHLPPIGDRRRTLGRFVDTRLDDERKLAQILLESGAAVTPEPDEHHVGYLAGENARLRGIPLTHHGGASPGTRPEIEVEARDERRRRRWG